KDENPKIRREAVRILSDIKGHNSQTINMIKSLLNDPDNSVKREATITLKKIWH
ncbi:MAG: hypothetical protein DRO63_02320, partial [Candidatus Gerdarchaeota archaeon]